MDLFAAYNKCKWTKSYLVKNQIFRLNFKNQYLVNRGFKKFESKEREKLYQLNTDQIKTDVAIVTLEGKNSKVKIMIKSKEYQQYIMIKKISLVIYNVIIMYTPNIIVSQNIWRKKVIDYFLNW